MILQHAQTLLLATALGIAFQLALHLTRMVWLRQANFIMAATILPPVTAAITESISGDIALSLGMVGALSIVRFRNPVRSPFELVAYFGLITVGIASTVSPEMAGVLVLTVALVALLFRSISSRAQPLRALIPESINDNATVQFRGPVSIDLLSDFEVRSLSRVESEYEALIGATDYAHALEIVRQLERASPSGQWTIHRLR